ncbi:MAG: FHA domain-containing protein [Vicinamibacterales bacterium]
MTARFDRFVLDTRARRLARDGQDAHLSPKAFDLLALLFEQRPAVVEKRAIHERLWPGIHVGEASLSNLVAEIRRALHSPGLSGGPIRTVHGVGYAFAAKVDEPAERALERSTPPSHWVLVNEHPIPLSVGENLLGRDAACAIWVDASGVSRRHARIRVPGLGSSEPATIEDLASTNGTSVRGRRVTSPTALENGDRIRVGQVTVIYRGPTGIDAPTKRVRR